VQKRYTTPMRKLSSVSLIAFCACLLVLPANVSAEQKINLEIPNLRAGEALPKRYTAEGKGLSPPLAWTFAPTATLGFVLIMEDLDEARVQWILYEIPGKAVSLPEGIPDREVLTHPTRLSGTIQGIPGSARKSPGYVPPVTGHRCGFTIYALDAHLGLLPGLDRASLMTLIQGHIIGKGELTTGGGNRK
jgi:Raf kinase inhibitor-like YbhB/YbcL family protein